MRLHQHNKEKTAWFETDKWSCFAHKISHTAGKISNEHVTILPSKYISKDAVDFHQMLVIS